MKSISLTKSIFYNFLAPIVTVIFIVWIVIPYGFKSDIPLYWVEIPAYIIFFGGLVLATLLSLNNEGIILRFKNILSRLRIKKMSKRDWLWTIGLTVFAVISYVLLNTTVDWIKGTVIDGPDWLDIDGTLYGFEIAGNWWLVLIHLMILLFNVIGEEFWFHGYLLPRQELTHGKKAWIINGLLWYAYHLFWPWNLFRSLPESVASSFVCQKLGNTTPALVSHFIFNGIGLLLLILEVAK